MNEKANQKHISLVKNNFIWIKRPTRHLRDEPNPPYVNLAVSKDGMNIRVKPASGGDVTEKSYKLKSGRLEPTGIGNEVKFDLFERVPIAFKTQYNTKKDYWKIDLNKPVFEELSKSDITRYIRKQTGINGPTGNLRKKDFVRLYDCDDQFDLVDIFDEKLEPYEYNLSLTVSLNKPAYSKIAEELTYD